jgi:hypothetical protein
MPDLSETLVTRIEKLERERRVTRVLGALVLIAVAGLGLVAAKPARRTTVVTAPMAFKDAKGKERLWFGTRDDGSPAVFFSDARGATRGALLINDSGGFTLMGYDPDGKTTNCYLGESPSGVGSTLSLGSRAGKASVTILAIPDETAMLAMQQDEQLVMAYAARKNGAGLEIKDKEGKPVARLPMK